MDSAKVGESVVRVVDNMVADWGLDCPLSLESRLVADLGFESIDIIQLVVALESHFGKRGLGFDKLLMSDGRYVDDLTLGQITTFLHGKI